MIRASEASGIGLTVGKVTSKDGTSISFDRTGAGPPLILVHGTSGSSKRWFTTLPTLERQFTVYVVDRRGRGESGDSPTYSIEREFEDVAAVVDSVDQPVNLLGHSYGGICSMEASLLTKNVRKLILYEPPVPIPGVQIYPTGIVDKLQALKEQGNKEAVLTTFLREIVRMPSHELDLLQSQPAWSGRVAAAHTIPRELQAHQAYKFKAERFSNVRTPTMLLLGGDSPHFFKTAVELVKAALPSSQVVVLPGQQHVADQTAPELFLREVLRFLT